MSRVPAYRVVLVRDRWLRLEDDWTTTEAAERGMRAFLGWPDREVWAVGYLDSHSRVLGLEVVAMGHLTGAESTPREIWTGAVLAKAYGLLLAHTHPAGDATPSAQDRVVTARLVQVGALLGLPLFDHLVLGAETCVSLARESGKARL